MVCAALRALEAWLDRYREQLIVQIAQDLSDAMDALGPVDDPPSRG